jgi:hypothetical protein
MSNLTERFYADLRMAKAKLNKLFDSCAENGKPFEMKVEGVVGRGGRLEIRMFGSERSRVYLSPPFSDDDQDDTPPDGGA